MVFFLHKYYRLPLPPFTTCCVFAILVFSVIAPYIKLRLHGKDVSANLLFFLTIRRSVVRLGGGASWYTINNFSLVGYDARGGPVRLPPGLGNLPLYRDEGGWYSVLGSWNGATDNPNPANRVSKGNQESSHAIQAPTTNPPRDDSPGLPKIFCRCYEIPLARTEGTGDMRPL